MKVLYYNIIRTCIGEPYIEDDIMIPQQPILD